MYYGNAEFQDKRLPAGASALLKLEGNLALMLFGKLKQPETMKVNCWLCSCRIYCQVHEHPPEELGSRFMKIPPDQPRKVGMSARSSAEPCSQYVFGSPVMEPAGVHSSSILEWGNEMKRNGD